MVKSSNVRCLNGSAHVKTTRNKSEVTCAKCLGTDDVEQDDFWKKYDLENETKKSIITTLKSDNIKGLTPNN